MTENCFFNTGCRHRQDRQDRDFAQIDGCSRNVGRSESLGAWRIGVHNLPHPPPVEPKSGGGMCPPDPLLPTTLCRSKTFSSERPFQGHHGRFLAGK